MQSMSKWKCTDRQVDVMEDNNFIDITRNIALYVKGK